MQQTPAADTADAAPAPIAYKIEMVPAVSGLSRTRIFQAIRSKRLTARKDGRQTIIEDFELRRYIATLPAKGRQPQRAASAAERAGIAAPK
jgi:hypothetical protein